MRVRVRASGVVRSLILCGLIAETALTPFATARPRVMAAAGPGPRQGQWMPLLAPSVPPALPQAGAVAPTPARGTARTAALARAYAGLPLAFQPNVGQADPRVAYLARGGGFAAFLTATDATLAAARPRGPRGAARTAAPGVSSPRAREAVVRLRFVGANAHPRIAGLDRLPGVVNYLRGHARHTGVPTYARVAYRGVYPGVDLLYDGARGRLEYTWTLAPGADVRALRVAVQGARALRLDRAGNLVIETGDGALGQRRPVAYQQVGRRRRPIPARYALLGRGEVGVALGAHDARRAVVIDPVLSYSSYLGGSGDDNAKGIAVDAAGNAYVTGDTYALDYPLVGAAQGVYGGGGCTSKGCAYDAFVTKFNARGNALVYSTYLGGANDDRGNAIAVDAAGNAYVTGYTYSTNFPTANALQANSASPGYPDAFVTKLNAAGSGLVYSTYLGGIGPDNGLGIAVDAAGAAYVTGQTQSSNFPTANAAQPAYSGGSGDAFVTKLNAAGSGLVYSTYLGGAGGESGYGIAVDGAGSAYVTGYTSSTNFPVVNALQAVYGGSRGYPDAFVTKLAPTGTAFAYSTYLGGASQDIAYGIAVDAAGDAYVTGSTNSSNFPTKNAFQSVFGGPVDAFVSELNAAGSGLVYSTFLGNGSSDDGFGIAVDGAGRAYVTGDTSSATFPTQNAVQGTFGGPAGGLDAFVATLLPGGGGLGYSTYLGGGGNDEGTAIAVDGSGSAYVAGLTASTNFPTRNAVQGTYGGGSEDAFVARIAMPASGAVPWRPHSAGGGLGAIGGGTDVSVDLADGHVDVGVAGVSIPGRGPDLTVRRTWDSTLAQNGAAAGLSSSLTPRMGGALQGTVTYTDSVGTAWSFLYTGSPGATPPYTSYRTPPGQPWGLTTSTAGYTLTDILTSETWRFDAQGRLTADTDAYGNSNTLSYGAGGATSPTSETNSGGRSLALGYANGQLSDVASPLWQSSGGAQGQHVTYAYNASGQLTGATRGAGTSDAQTTTFGYTGALLTGITTPAGQTWTLGYDATGRVTSLTSPVSGTAGQPGYTPSYTTQYSYVPGQTTVVVGAGTSAALTTTYTLDAQGEATGVTDGLGNTSRSTYDRDHDVTSSTDANGNTTSNAYQYVGPNGSTGLVTQTVQPPIQPYSPQNGALVTPTTTHRYDPTTYDLIETDAPEGGVTTYSYDGHHSVVATTEQTTQQTCATTCATTWQGTLTQYDQYGERTATTDGRGVSVDAGGTATLNDPNGLYTSHLGYDAQGDLTSSSTPPITTTLNGGATTASATTSYTYDGDGNRQTMVSANGNTTSYSYDHLGRQTATTLPAVTLYNNTTTNPVETTGYDADGHAVRQSDANGNSTTSAYDSLGRLVAQTNPVSGTSVTTYTAGEVTAQQDAQGNVTAYGYDGAGRQIQTTDPATGTTQTAYDAVGNTVAMTTTDRTNGNAVVTLEQLGYDALNRVITATVVTNTANIAGSALTTLTRYDRDGNVAQTQQPNGDVVYNVYDAADRLTNVELDPAPLSKGQAATHPSYEVYGYDGAGNQTLTQDADNRADTTQYDGDNRVVQDVAVSYPPTGTTTITTTMQYDPNGNSVRQATQTVDSTNPGQAQTHVTTSSYNAADWKTATTVDGLTTNYSYDAAGRQIGTTTSDGQTGMTMGYDAAGRVTSIGENAGGAGPYVTGYSYNANDLPTALTAPNGTRAILGYDANSQLTSLVETGPAQTPATTTLQSSYAYGYNAAGWIVGTTTLSGTDALTHDASGRLTDECGPQVITLNQCNHWTYDKNGNLLTAVGDMGATDVYTYSATQINEQVAGGASDSPPTATIALAYDGHGDTTSISNAVAQADPTDPGYKKYARLETFAYDAQQRPITVTRLDSTRVGTATIVTPLTATLAYNTDGLRSDYLLTPDPRTGKQAVDTRFAYRDGELASATVTDITGTLLYKNTFVYGPSGEPLELIRTNPDKTTSRYWYVLDGLGSVVALTDASGRVVDRYAYDSWGEETSNDATDETVPQQLRYRGYYYDEKLTYYWVSVRYYDPEGMRWLQPDPSDHDGIRTYTYVDNDPVDATDPTGCCRVEVKFKPVNRLKKGPIDLTLYWHAYIVTSDSSGSQFFRGGPECGTGGSDSGSSNSGNRNVGSSNSGSCNVGSSNSGNNNIGSSNSGAHHRGIDQRSGGFFGYIRTAHGTYLPGSTDYPKNPSDPRRTMFIYNDRRACGYWNDKFVAVLARIDAANIDYDPRGPNSNTVIHQTLITAGLGQHTPHDTVVGAPGWNTSIRF